MWKIEEVSTLNFLYFFFFFNYDKVFVEFWKRMEEKVVRKFKNYDKK